MKRKIRIVGEVTRRKVKILGKKAIPLWLLMLALVVAGAGAAVGTVLTGKVTGESASNRKPGAVGGPACCRW